MGTQIQGANPILLQNVGDAYPFPCRVHSIIWDSASASGDRVQMDKLGINYAPFLGRLWSARTSDTNTYLGASWAPYGVHCPAGFVLSAIGSGTILVYLMES